jgi:large repetitive protein
MQRALAFLLLSGFLALSGCGSTKGGSTTDSGSGGKGGAGGSGTGSGGKGGSGGSDGGAGAGGSAHDGSTDGDAATTTDGGSDMATETGATSFHVSGTVAGLTGSGLMLADGAGHQLAVSASGAFALTTAFATGTHVTVTVAQQPSMPSQTCQVAGGDITAITHDVTDVAVTCVTNSYMIGGSVTGLVGSGLVLTDNSGDDLHVTTNGTIAFAIPVDSGATFTVTVKTQPATPAQTCQISGGSGTVGGDDVTSVMVNCSINTYAIGGTVSGLVGTGLVLQNNNGDDLSVTSNGNFAFATPLQSGDMFAVTVKTQPSSPQQTCSVSQGTGTAASGNVNTVAVVCSTQAYAVGGTATGVIGTGLALQNNLGDNLTINADGTFTFAANVASGGAYAVSVVTQPSSPAQVCTVTNGTGTVGTAPVTNVAVSCATSSFTVGGTVFGLAGTGLVLQNSGGDDLAIAADGSFTFATSIISGGSFAVTVATQPSAPVQSCTVLGGSGTVGNSAVTSVSINCSTSQFAVGGTVTGLTGTGLTVALNGATPLAISSSGGFAFANTLASGGSYAVTIASQPTSPSQTCTVSNGSGNIAASAISDVAVNCTTNSYTVGGSVTGVLGAGLILRNNGGDDLTVAADGTFTFATSVPSGQGYAVTVAAQPTSPWQTCTVASGSGGVAGSNITNVNVTCTTNSYTVGGMVSGLNGTLVLLNNGDSLNLTANGSFSFGTAITSGGTYAVTVSGQPSSPRQTCTVTGGSGSIAGAAVTGISVTCVTNRYAVGGTTFGLLGTGLTLQNNGGDDLVVAPGSPFTFATGVDSGASYSITIKTQPSSPTQSCTVSGGTGTITAAPITSVTINCSTNSYTVGGSASNLVGSGLVLQYNGGSDLSVTGTGSFAFPTPVSSGSTYSVTVKTQPTSPSQTCTVTGGSGTVTNVNVTTVQVSCAANPYDISVAVTNLVGSGLVLQDNAADNLSITGNGTFTFATKVPSGMTYSVTVLSQPTFPWQTCTVTAPSGPVGAGPVTLAVNCVTNKYSVAGTVSGLTGSGLVLQDNGGDNLGVTTNGTFTFATTVASGAPYAVTVGTSPTSPAQTCVVTSGSGTITAFNVTNVAVACSNTAVCGAADENQTLSLTCPTGTTISAATFASYGTPNGACGSFTTSACNAATSASVVNTACQGKNSCTVGANNGVFGDPCVGTFKRLWVQVSCQ